MKHYAYSKMDHLPDEIILLIFDFSSVYDLTTSFQRVCTRWKYLINRSEKIWRGKINLKGLTEQKCQNKLCEVLKQTPKLKYLQIGNANGCISNLKKTGKEIKNDEMLGRTEDILETIQFYNKELEYLHVIDRFPLAESLNFLLNRSNFRRLKITLNKLCDRRKTINDLKNVFQQFPEPDNLCIDFSQRIQFYCEKKNSGWKIRHDIEANATDEFL